MLPTGKWAAGGDEMDVLYPKCYKIDLQKVSLCCEEKPSWSDRRAQFRRTLRAAS
jgi:hypothetical protein